MSRWIKARRIERRWRWVLTLLNAISYGWAFLVWMGWWNVITAAVALSIGWLVFEATAAHWLLIVAATLFGWLLLSVTSFFRWRAAALRVVATAAPPHAAGASEPPPPSPVRRRVVSFMELRNIAAEYGWDFRTYSDQLGNLVGGLRQAAVDPLGTGVVILGRANCANMPESMKLQYPLVPIPEAHFHNWWIDYSSPTNWQITTYKPGQERASREGYRDLHLSDEGILRRWLQADGPSYKSPTCNITARTALRHIMSSGLTAEEAISRFENAALAGVMKVYGKNNVGDGYISMGHEEIPPSRWQYATLDDETFDLEELGYPSRPHEATIAVRTPDIFVESYCHLRVNKERVLEIWPSGTLINGSTEPEGDPYVSR